MPRADGLFIKHWYCQESQGCQFDPSSLVLPPSPVLSFSAFWPILLTSFSLNLLLKKKVGSLGTFVWLLWVVVVFVVVVVFLGG